MKAQTLLKAKKYTGILPFLSGICWGATGIFVRTLENAGVDNFTIITAVCFSQLSLQASVCSSTTALCSM